MIESEMERERVERKNNNKNVSKNAKNSLGPARVSFSLSFSLKAYIHHASWQLNPTMYPIHPRLVAPPALPAQCRANLSRWRSTGVRWTACLLCFMCSQLITPWPLNGLIWLTMKVSASLFTQNRTWFSMWLSVIFSADLLLWLTSFTGEEGRFLCFFSLAQI